MKNEHTGFKGTLKIDHFDGDGNLLASFTKDNLIVNTGLSYFAARNASNTTGAVSHMGMGSGSVAPAAANTTLGTELGRVVTANSISTTTVANDTAVFTSTFGAGVATGAIQEAGLFNAASAGIMVSRITFAVINKGASDSITATWSIQSK
jgi:hypothetical protein